MPPGLGVWTDLEPNIRKSFSFQLNQTSLQKLRIFEFYQLRKLRKPQIFTGICINRKICNFVQCYACTSLMRTNFDIAKKFIIISSFSPSLMKFRSCGRWLTFLYLHSCAVISNPVQTSDFFLRLTTSLVHLLLNL